MHNRIKPWIFGLIVAFAVATLAAAQARPAAPSQKPVAAAPISEQEAADTQRQLIKILRMSPTLTSVVARDPSLLADQEYVSRNNPELAQFLASHPEVVRNPEFYLFTNLEMNGVRRDQALERAVWPDLVPPSQPQHARPAEIVGPIAGMLAFACFLGALVWLIRLFLENRRWSRAFRQQSETHARLIDKFGSTQELAAYMETDAGKRFLESAPIPVDFEQKQRVPNALARVLTPLQIGVVLVMLGVGLLLFRNATPEMGIPMLVMGTVILMPGIGFILSAGITWVLAGRLGLMPAEPLAPKEPPSDAQDRL
jgi:hypothetical protein